MSSRHHTMIDPRIEDLLERAGDSKFRLVTLGAKRARQINSYFGQLGDGLGTIVPPQVNSVARKPLSIAFEEISADKIVKRLAHAAQERVWADELGMHVVINDDLERAVAEVEHLIAEARR